MESDNKNMPSVEVSSKAPRSCPRADLTLSYRTLKKSQKHPVPFYLVLSDQHHFYGEFYFQEHLLFSISSDQILPYP